jgi:hypothetical protein
MVNSEVPKEEEEVLIRIYGSCFLHILPPLQRDQLQLKILNCLFLSRISTSIASHYLKIIRCNLKDLHCYMFVVFNIKMHLIENR